MPPPTSPETNPTPRSPAGSTIAAAPFHTQSVHGAFPAVVDDEVFYLDGGFGLFGR
ncbi:MAG: hypothetical protein ACRDSJ_00685 [Rubrobacteraceae bacterium]